MRPDFLITGVGSGLGKFIHRTLGGVGMTRSNQNDVFSELKSTGVNTIIHCAFSAMKDVHSENIAVYAQDNIQLTEKLLSIPHDRFIYLSTVDVYPRDENAFVEDQKISLNMPTSIYATTKLINEGLVKNQGNRPLILRPTSLLGIDSRKNTLSRIIEEAEPKVFLSENSTFNYVLHDDIRLFIELSLAKGIEGTFNLASRDTVNLGEVAKFLGKKVGFGEHTYSVGSPCIDKVEKVCNFFSKTSIEALKLFLATSK